MLISLCTKVVLARNAENFLIIQMSGLSMRSPVILKKMVESAGIVGKSFLEVMSSLSTSFIVVKNKKMD
jgi:hypothetical protein